MITCLDRSQYSRIYSDCTLGLGLEAVIFILPVEVLLGISARGGARIDTDPWDEFRGSSLTSLSPVSAMNKEKENNTV